MTRELIAEARELATRAYAPYSNFWVGAIVIDEHGNRYEGTNVEKGKATFLTLKAR